MNKSILDEIELKLKGSLVAMEKVAEGRYLPKVFAEAALSELQKVLRLVKEQKRKKETK